MAQLARGGHTWETQSSTPTHLTAPVAFRLLLETMRATPPLPLEFEARSHAYSGTVSIRPIETSETTFFDPASLLLSTH